MITISKTSVETPDDYVKNPLINIEGIYRHADVFYKKQLSGRKGDPLSHDFDERLVLAAEFLYQLFFTVLGEKARPFFYDTYRVKGDSNYYVGNNKSKGLSNHALGKAGDLNWPDQETEDYILHVISHDVRIKGTIYKKLMNLGIGGIGTYFRSSFGTFIHLDTGTNRHWDKYSEKNKIKAQEQHEDFMSKVLNDPVFINRLPGVTVPVIDDTDDITFELPETVSTIEVENEPAVMDYPQAVATDLVKSVDFLWEKEEEDPMLKNYMLGQWFLRIAAIVAVVVAFIAFRKYNTQKIKT